MRTAFRLAGLGLCLAALPSVGFADWYGKWHARPPAGDRLYICHGYSCRFTTPLQLSGAEIRRIVTPLTHRYANAVSERAAISRAVQNFEKVVGARTGTSGDLPRTQVGQAKPDQMDCVDEATNTTSLLRLLSERGLLKHHEVREPAARGFFLDGRYPHATAVLAETAGGEKWAIDSWPRANGEAPVIQPLPVWYRDRSVADPS
jgi:hypothetical protein